MAILRPDSYERIQGYAAAYAEKVKSFEKGIGNTNPDDDVCAVIMEKWDVARLLFHPKCHKIAAIIGIEKKDESDEASVTIALLAVDEHNKVLTEHYRRPAPGDLRLEGEEVWPRRVTIRQLPTFLPEYEK